MTKIDPRGATGYSDTYALLGPSVDISILEKVEVCLRLAGGSGATGDISVRLHDILTNGPTGTTLAGVTGYYIEDPLCTIIDLGPVSNQAANTSKWVVQTRNDNYAPQVDERYVVVDHVMLTYRH